MLPASDEPKLNPESSILDPVLNHHSDLPPDPPIISSKMIAPADDITDPERPLPFGVYRAPLI